MTPEYIIGLCALILAVISSLSTLYLSMRNQRHTDKEKAISRETSLRELMDGYVAQIREYESQISVLKDRIADMVDRISCLETALASNGISTPPYGRRASDHRKTDLV